MLLVTMRVSVRMIVALTTRRNPQALVHGHKRHEANEDGQAEDQVAVRLDKHKAGPVRLVLADEDLGQQVEERVAEKAADGKGHHDGQRRGIDVGRHEGEQEVGRAGDVQRGQQSIHGGRSREQHREELRREGRGRGLEMGSFGGVELLDNGASLVTRQLVKTCPF